MNDLYEEQFTAPEQPLASAEVRHAEPQMGGSFTRNVATGALVKSVAAPADQPEQE